MSKEAIGPVFVFGSNDQGRHFKGAAKDALDYYGAIVGQGEGLQNQSYGIPTKYISFGQGLLTCSMNKIKSGINTFNKFALSRPDTIFMMTKIGTGLAQIREEDIYSLLKDCPSNVDLPMQWCSILDREMVSFELYKELYPTQAEKLKSLGFKTQKDIYKFKNENMIFTYNKDRSRIQNIYESLEAVTNE